MVATYWADQPAIRGESTGHFTPQRHDARPRLRPVPVDAFLRTSAAYLRDDLRQKSFSDR